MKEQMREAFEKQRQLINLFERWKGYELPDLNSDNQFDKEWLHREWVAYQAGYQAALSAVPAQEPAPTMSQFASKADYEAAISKQPAPVTVTLTGHQLRCALALINPDGETDIDQLEDYLTFGIVTHYDDAGVIGRGMACWNDDTDGVLPLDDALFEPAKQEGKWISVDTKLPELGEKVIGIYDGSLCAFMRVCAEDDNWCWAIGRNDLYDEFFYDADDDYQITHWMPLPLNAI